MEKANRLEVFRSNDWWGYKLPPLFGFAYLIIHLHGTPLGQSWQILAFLLFWMIGAAGFGYYSNDVFDVEEDRVAGKENSAASHSWHVKALLMTVLAMMALLPWIIYLRPAVLVLAVIHLLLFLVYSMHPIRIKQRGAIGVFADAVYAHLLPTIIVIFAVWPESAPVSGSQWVLCATLLLWQFILGVRGIIEHQIADFDVDKKAGSSNFVQRIGVEQALNWDSGVLLKLEVFALMLFLLALLWNIPVIASIVLITLFIMYMLKPFGEGLMKYRPDNRSIVNRGLNQIQEMVLPLIFLSSICTQHSDYLVIAIFHIGVFLPGHMQLFDIGKDHLAKPIYYKGVLKAYYTGKSGANVSFQTLIKIYANALRPIYFEWKKLALWFYYRGLWSIYRLLKWVFYNTLVWFFYNVPYRFASWLWHLLYYLKHGQWHPEFSKNQMK